MAKHNELGIWGENTAARYLEHKGYSIRERNWKFGRKEVDIIAQGNKLIVFVEVKTRSTNSFGAPEESVDKKKQQYLITAADQYLQQLDFDADARFDIISLIKSGDHITLDHIEEAFIPRLE